MVAGTSARESVKEMKRLKNEPLLLLVIIAIILFVGIFVIYPVVKVILFPDGGTYLELFNRPRWLTAIKNSLFMTLVSTISCTAVAFLFAYVIARLDVPCKGLFRFITLLPIVSPPFIVALSYIAAQRTLYGYNDMADAKALLESIARSFGYIYGREKHVRINTVSQSPTPTTAGSGVLGLGDLMEFAENMSPLGNASAEDCADYVLTLFSDLTRKVTMQNLYHDGGFSSMGMSRRAMKTYEKGLRFDDVHQNQYPFGEGEK